MDKSTSKKPAVKKATAKSETAEKKPRVSRAKKVEQVIPPVESLPVEETAVDTAPALELKLKPTIADGRYIFATGRRKTAVANLRLFSGKGDLVVNKKPIGKYFFHKLLSETATKPFHVTGLANDFYFTVTVNGGGMNAQAEAVRHALSQALASMGEDIHKLLKKNGFLTRDSREKERKKPGLRRARRSPQWAKR